MQIEAAAQRLRQEAPGFFELGPPEVHLVLGSGLSLLADQVQDSTTMPFTELPGLVPAGVSGHRGVFIMGHLGGRRVLVQAGRSHMYEGHAAEVVVAPIRVGAALGSPVLVLTNAAGGIDRRLDPGALMVIDDHINFMWRSPLKGPVVGGESRFPDMSDPYDRRLQSLAHQVGLDLGIQLERGTYAAVLGPSYETVAEIEMLNRMGAHAVGMSTAPEAITAAALGLRVLGISMISNRATGLGPPLDHAEVMEEGKRAGETLGRLLAGVLERLPGA